MPEQFMSLEAVAKLLDISERTVVREVKAGRLRSFRAGRAYRFSPEAIEEYIKNQEVTPEAGTEGRTPKHKDAA